MQSPTSRWGPADAFLFPWGAAARDVSPAQEDSSAPNVAELLGGGALPLLAGVRELAHCFPARKEGWPAGQD